MVGLGVRELSVAPTRVPAVKGVKLAEMQEWAERALELE